MKKSLFWVLFMGLTVVLLTGCSGKAEIDELGFVMGIGVDAGKRPGYYDVTYQFALPKSGEGGTKPEPLTITVEAHSIREARTYVDQMLDRIAFIGTTRVFIIGEEAAKQGIDQVLEIAQRFYEFRRTLFLVVAKGRAEDILRMELGTGSLVSLHIASLIQQSGEISRVPITRLGHFLTVLGTEGKQPIIGLVEKVVPGGEEIRYQSSDGQPEHLQMKSAAAFRGDKLEVLLSEEETEGALYLLNEVESKVIAVKEGELEYAGTIIKSKTKPELITVNGQVGVRFQIKVIMDLDVIIDPGFRNYGDVQDVIARAESQLEQSIQSLCEAAIQKCREQKLDFVGIGRIIHMKNPKYWKIVKNDWENRLPQVPVEIDVQLRVRNIGTSYQPPRTNS